jgi:hypothetical protein
MQNADVTTFLGLYEPVISYLQFWDLKIFKITRRYMQ